MKHSIYQNKESVFKYIENAILFHMKRFTSKTQKIGEYGEKICSAFLMKQNFKIIECNYTQRFGEIDIIAEENKVIHFIEVKSIRGRKIKNKTYNPAQNLDQKKYNKIYKTMMHYIRENNVSYETRTQIDLYAVYIDEIHKNHQIEIIENLVFS